MATVVTAPARVIPGAIRSGLKRVERRIRLFGLLRGLGMLAALLAAGAAAGMVTDFLWPLPTAVRWAIWLGWVGAGLVMLGGAVARPVVRRMRWDDLAAVAEAGNPELGERLVSTVGLLGEGREPH